MKKISLTQGQFAMVDDADFEWLNQWKWCAAWNFETKSFYVVREVKRKQVYMHRVILDAPKGMMVDHKNHDTLNNQRINIRLATYSQNAMNAKMLNSDNTSGYRGVSWRKRRKRFRVQIRKEGKDFYLGSFKNPKEGAKIYNEKAKELFGEFSFINKIET